MRVLLEIFIRNPCCALHVITPSARLAAPSPFFFGAAVDRIVLYRHRIVQIKGRVWSSVDGKASLDCISVLLGYIRDYKVVAGDHI